VDFVRISVGQDIVREFGWSVAGFLLSSLEFWVFLKNYYCWRKLLTSAWIWSDATEFNCVIILLKQIVVILEIQLVVTNLLSL